MPSKSLSLLALLAPLGTLALFTSPALAAQDSATVAHPLIGVWEMRVDLCSGDTGCPTQIAFAPDHSSVQVDCEGVVAVGVWEPSGDTSANLTITAYNPDLGRYMIRLAIDVAEDGQSFTGTFTFELVDETSSEGLGQYGPGTAIAARQIAEEPGTPAGTIADMFARFQTAPDATPVA
jgi:hypothetical protein